MNRSRQLAVQAYRWGTHPYRSWVLGKQKRAGQAPIAAIFYHRVADYSPTPWTISCRAFEQQIFWLKKRFDIISIAEAQQRIRCGNHRPAVCITFDDGYEDNCDFALPFLASQNLPTMYYVTTGYLDGNSPFPHDRELGLDLRPNRVRSLRRWVGSSISFGGHTRTHEDLGPIQSLDRLHDEIVTASEELSHQLDTPVEHFAFPFGQRANLSREAIEVARQGGLKSVCFAFGGWNQVGGRAFEIQRMHGDPAMARFKNWLSGDPRTFQATPFCTESEHEARDRVVRFLEERRIRQQQALPHSAIA